MHCFSLDNLGSFQDLPDAYEFLLSLRTQNKPEIILVGTKSDVDDSKRVVTKEEAEELASRLGCEYFEVSSLTKSNVNEAFQCIGQKTYDYYKARQMIRRPNPSQTKQKEQNKKKPKPNEQYLI